jgi:pentapeptide MXKDX repeat protein
MPDLRLVGVHDDGEHLLLVDDHGDRYLLAVDEALRAAVRRDRPRLGQLQLETQGGLRPRDVQARIRAGATSEEVAVLAGWSVEKVRRYEGPVLAERAHVADLARRVRLRRRGGETVLLGTEVAARLEDRGVPADSVAWDAWRTEDGPWTVVVYFAAGGRERQARWHMDLTSSSVTPVDDEARWLSEESAPADGPVPGLRLSAVPSSGVYDIEADGGVGSSAARDTASRTRTVSSGNPPAGTAASLDLVTAMRSRRREPGRGMPVRTATARPLASSTDDPAAVPGSRHPAHQAGRRRPSPPEPLELDPTLMDDPPAAHPPASVHPDVASASASVVASVVADPVDGLVDVPLPLGEDVDVEPVESEPVSPAVREFAGHPVDEAVAEDTVAEDTVAKDAVAKDTVAKDTVAEDTVAEDAVAEDAVAEDAVAGAVPENAVEEDEPAVGAAAVVAAAASRRAVLDAPLDAPLDPVADRVVVAEQVTVVEEVAAIGSGRVVEEVTVVEASAVIDVPVDAPAEDAPAEPAAPQQGEAAPTRTPERTARQRPGGRSRNRRSSVPSWDDIMFGAKRD